MEFTRNELIFTELDEEEEEESYSQEVPSDYAEEDDLPLLKKIKKEEDE